MTLPFELPKAPSPTAFLDPEEPQATGEDLGEHGFTREFEGVPETPGDAPPPLIGPVPEVDLGHAAMISDEPEKVWVLPTAELLDTITGKRERLAAEVRATGDKIVSTLQSFGIETRIVGANSGPTVTQYELQPAVGVPVRRILGYQTDLALALAAPIRIQPFIPGKSAIGVEVPNKAAQLVSLKETIESPAFADRRNKLSVALGADVSGHPVIGDLTRMPHLLIAGATGSGKSVCINAVLGGFLLQATPAQLKMILIDPKRVELSNFADLPHLLVPVVVEPEAAVASLRWAVKEMEERYKLFASHAARNIVAFNEKAPGLGLAPLPYIVIVIDELADLMMVAAGEIEDLICRIAQLARAVGLHLIVATQRPSADIITGLIKANIPSRVAFAVSSGVDSRVILDEMGAEKLLGRGDMLYLPIDEGKPRRLQGAFVSDRELDTLIGHWKLQGKPDYQEEIFTVEATVSWARDASKRDPLFAKAAHTVAAEGRAAASLLQRKLSVGYTRAARLIDQLAEHGVVGPVRGQQIARRAHGRVPGRRAARRPGRGVTAGRLAGPAAPRRPRCRGSLSSSLMAQDHSFDVVSEFDRQELVNAVDQARREITTRYDFKGITVEITLEDETITLLTGTDAQLKSIIDVLQSKAHRRGIDLKVLDPQKPEPAAKGNVRQVVKLRKGIGEELARDLTKRIRGQHPKAQVRTQGDQLRVSSKDKDELQAVIQQLRDLDLDVPLQFTNYR